MDEDTLRRAIEAAGLDGAFEACPDEVRAAARAAAALRAGLAPVDDVEVGPWPEQGPGA